MKRYNFFEKILVTLAWIAFLAMAFLFFVNGFYSMAMNGSDSAMIMSLIALIVLLILNVVNHFLKSGESDSRNVVFHLVALGYSLVYLVALFLFGFEEKYAWYPLGFLISYFGGVLIDIMFVLLYNRVEAREKRTSHRHHLKLKRPHIKAKKTHRTKNNEQKIPAYGTKSQFLQRINFVSILNTEDGIADLNNVIKKEIPEIKKPVEILVAYQNEEIDEKMKMYFVDRFDVKLNLNESDWDWFVEYVKKKNNGKLFAKTEKVFDESDLLIEDIEQGSSSTRKEAQAYLKNAAELEFKECFTSALEDLKNMMYKVLVDRLDCATDIKWLGYLRCYSKDDNNRSMIGIIELKKECAKFFKKTGHYKEVFLSKSANVEVNTEDLEMVIANKTLTCFDLYIEEEKALLDHRIRQANSRRYFIVDSKDGLKSLSTAISLYLYDRLEAINPDDVCLPIKTMPIEAKPYDLISEWNGQYYNSIRFDIRFTKEDTKYFESFCRAVSLGPIKDYGDKGKKFFMKHINNAIAEFLKPENNVRVGVRPKDKSSEYWTSMEPVGEEPIPLNNHYRIKVVVHWETMDWDNSCWYFNLRPF